MGALSNVTLCYRVVNNSAFLLSMILCLFVVLNFVDYCIMYTLDLVLVHVLWHFVYMLISRFHYSYSLGSIYNSYNANAAKASSKFYLLTKHLENLIIWHVTIGYCSNGSIPISLSMSILWHFQFPPRGETVKVVFCLSTPSLSHSLVKKNQCQLENRIRY